VVDPRGVDPMFVRDDLPELQQPQRLSLQGFIQRQQSVQSSRVFRKCSSRFFIPHHHRCSFVENTNPLLQS
jgi:hypothetical protein